MSVNRTVQWTIAGLLTAMLAGTAIGETRTLKLSPNSSEKVDIRQGIRNVYITNPSVVDARPEDNGYSVLISALSQGKAEVRIARISMEDLVYAVEVEPALKELADEVAAMIGDIEGAEVKIVGDKIAITGELLTQSSMRKVEGVVKIFKEKVVNLTSLDPNSWQFVRKALEKAIGIDTVEVKVDDDRILLLGTVPTAEDLERIREIAKKSVENVTILLQVQKP